MNRMNNGYLKSVAMSGLFKYLDETACRKAWDELNMMPRRYDSQQVIYGQDEPVFRPGIVHSGLVKGEHLHAEGASNLAYYYGRGEVFAFEGALSGKKTSPLQITADDDACVIFFDVQNVFNSTFERFLLKGLMELLAHDAIKKLYRIEILSKTGIRERIMAHFYVMASKTDGRSFALNMSQKQLAQYLCVNRSALSHELNQMKREGIIALEKRRVTLLERTGIGGRGGADIEDGGGAVFGWKL